MKNDSATDKGVGPRSALLLLVGNRFILSLYSFFSLAYAFDALLFFCTFQFEKNQSEFKSNIGNL